MFTCLEDKARNTLEPDGTGALAVICDVSSHGTTWTLDVDSGLRQGDIFNEPLFHGIPHQGNYCIATHRCITLVMDENAGEIARFNIWRNYYCTEHFIMTSRLAHQQFSVFIQIIFHEANFLEQGRTLQFRNSIFYHSYRLSTGVHFRS